MQGRTILLIIAGGIAAYKSLELIRRLREREVRVRCILTRAGAEFVTPLAVASLAGEKVFSDLFSLTDEAEMGHIRLSREADLRRGRAGDRGSDRQDGQRAVPTISPRPRCSRPISRC